MNLESSLSHKERYHPSQVGCSLRFIGCNVQLPWWFSCPYTTAPKLKLSQYPWMVALKKMASNQPNRLGKVPSRKGCNTITILDIHWYWILQSKQEVTQYIHFLAVPTCDQTEAVVMCLYDDLLEILRFACNVSISIHPLVKYVLKLLWRLVMLS